MKPSRTAWRTARICDIHDAADIERTLFFTLDIDWANDQVLRFCSNLFSRHGITATFFVTHDTPVLNELRASKLFELGLHPNFNYLLTGDSRYGSTHAEVLKHYRAIVPDAVSVRSHSLVQGSQILGEFVTSGFRFDANLLIPWNSGTALKVIRHWDSRMVRVPYCWEDDTHLTYGDPWDPDAFLAHPGLKVLDFHPIHIYLNTEVLSRYDAARPFLQQPLELERHINTTKYGVRNFLEDLIQRIK